MSTQVTCTPGLMGGAPCIGGTRIPVSVVEIHMRDGLTEEQMRVDYPTLPVGAYDAVRLWKADHVRDAIASAEIEGLEIRPATRRLMDRYIAGEISIEDAIQALKQDAKVDQ